MKNAVLLLGLVLVCGSLGGCGALVAGGAAGLAAGAVIKHSNETQPGPTYIPPRPPR